MSRAPVPPPAARQGADPQLRAATPRGPAAPLADRVLAHVEAERLLDGGGLTLLAVSGGPDSLALLDLMAGLAGRLALAPLVVHADHGIHPRSALVADQVARIARERYGLETLVGALGLGPGTGETRAREARYRFFRRVQRERGARFLLTAHQADDQVETVVLRLLRGSGTAGLAGIPARGPRGLVRPLLPFTRAELAAHVAALGLPVFDDPANRDSRHTRSWVRAELLPLLAARLGEAVRERLLAVQRHAAEEVLAWDLALDALAALEVRAAQERVEIARAALASYPRPLAARLVRAAARRAGLVLGPSQAARTVAFAAEAASGRRLDLGGGLEADSSFDRLLLRRSAAAPAAAALSGESGECRFGAFRLRWRAEAAPARQERAGWSAWVSPGALALRAPARGDRMVPLGGTGHRAVSRLLMEARVPRAERARYPLVAREGEPLWIPGVCRGSGALPAAGTPAVRLDAETL